MILLYRVFAGLHTHSFIASRLIDRLEGKRKLMTTPFITKTPTGEMYQSLTWFQDVPIKFGNYALYANLIEIDMTDFDVILGMDWLTTHQAVIDCKKKRVRFNPLGAKPFEFCGTSRGKTALIISVL